MIDYRVEIEDEQVRAVLKAFGSGAFLEPAAKRIGVKLTTDLRRYPAQPSGSTYRRTGLLGRRWVFKVRAGLFGASVTAGNNTVYAQWVQSEAKQAWMHEGRWQTEEQVLEANVDYIEKEVNEAVEDQINKAT